MSKRNIDLARCLVHDGAVNCHLCEKICPQNAIQEHVIDMSRCDGCGLCQAVCPTAAIMSTEDYERALEKAAELEPQALMCQKAGEGNVSCLGFLNRRILWALASKRSLCLDISRCQKCRPAVYEWLLGEVEACNEALHRAQKDEIRLVHVKPQKTQPKPAPKVERRSFFQALFHSTAKGLQEIADSQIERFYFFDEMTWMKRQGPQRIEANTLFYGMAVRQGCTACGLCAVVCPTNALTFSREERRLHFDPLLCKKCGLCAAHCPSEVLALLPHFNGQRDFSC